jgi:NAD(P)-dependent dehydrogenase (short-subunit alcohol dehydrogenase family)
LPNLVVSYTHPGQSRGDMASFNPADISTAILKDKVVVLTGGSSGIGAATVALFHSLGAKVIFGDVNSQDGDMLVESLAKNSPSSDDPGVHFLQCDVRSYADNLALFKAAMDKYGRVDHAVANAGVSEQGVWFDPGLGIEGVEEDPGDPITLDVNLKAVVLFARIACQYLAHGNEKAKEDKSIVLVSSLAGFIEFPSLQLYQAAKHGVLGLMRSLRTTSLTAFHRLRVNAVCPGVTRTPMTKSFAHVWATQGLPINESEHVAQLIVALCAAGPGCNCLLAPAEDGLKGKGPASDTQGMKRWNVETDGVHGRAMTVDGGESWEIEQGLELTMPIWMRKGSANYVLKGQEVAARIAEMLQPAKN